MILDLPAHSLHLHTDAGPHFVLACGIGAVGFLGEHRQRIFQSVREITGFRECPADDPLTVFQQGIQIGDQRLYFCGIGSFDPAKGTITETR